VEEKVEEKVETKVETKSETKPEADTTTEKQSSVVKLLKQRNEARAEVEELKAKIKDNAELEARVKELEESIARQELAKEAQKEKDAFLEKYPMAK
jgi:predicted component of type VI protein secretion system